MSVPPGTSSRTSTPSSAAEPERLHVGWNAGEVGIGEPERLAGRGRDQLVHPQQRPARRLARHDAHGDVARGGPAAQRRDRRGERRARHGPDPFERALDCGHRGPAHLHAGIAPRGDAAGRVTDPASPTHSPVTWPTMPSTTRLLR